MQYIEVKQGKRGRWRYTAYEDVGFGKRLCGPLAYAYGFDSQEAAVRNAEKWFQGLYEIRVA